MGASKHAVNNKARVEGSVCALYLQRETTYFCSHYFKNFSLLPNTNLRNDPRSIYDNMEASLSILHKQGRASGSSTHYWLTDNEWKYAHIHVLINCNEVKPYLE